MKISIITATWNSGATLRDTMESVLAQTYSNWEHIIIDGCSSDNTLDIVREFEPRYNGRLRYISEKDHGIYDAMNKGIKIATGDIIGILNSDDFYAYNDVLCDIASYINDVDVVYGNLDFVDTIDTTKVVRKWRGSQHKTGAFLRGWHPAHPTFYARKECFIKFGDFNITYAVSADFELMLRFIERYKVSNRFIPRIMIKMRIGGESTNSFKKIIQGNKNVVRAFHENGFKVSPFYLIRRLIPKAFNMIKNKII